MSGIDNSLEILAFAERVLLDLAEAQADDGKVSVYEIVSLALGNASAAIAAASGAGEIKVELSDLDADEVKQIAEKGIAVANAAMKLFKKG